MMHNFSGSKQKKKWLDCQQSLFNSAQNLTYSHSPPLCIWSLFLSHTLLTLGPPSLPVASPVHGNLIWRPP